MIGHFERGRYSIPAGLLPVYAHALKVPEQALVSFAPCQDYTTDNCTGQNT
jgi:hypothetical protein